MPFNTTPSLGINLNAVQAKPWYDINFGTISPKLGTKVIGDDGRTYVLLLAAGAISANAQVTITQPAMTAVAGTGDPYYAQGTAVANGQYFWARAGAL